MKALVVGASGGIGQAVTAELRQRRGEHAVTGLSRRSHGLDVTDEASVRAALGALDGPFDLIFVATGALVVDGYEPEKTIKSFSARGLADQVALNAAGPMLVLKHALPLMPRDRRCVFAALSARVGSIGDNRLGGWYSYRAAKACLNALLHGAAVEVARTHKQAIVAMLHPGTVQTDFTAKYARDYDTVAPATAAANLLDVIDDLGPLDSGSFHDYAGRRIEW